ncbi:MAG: YggT family protein [Novosphingobium sp.]|jgi:YggT family protein|uniref:YggT family protein n=1 Tax=unclassified Novosphingobium TaxID=2644732 RepID=UPI0006B91186|nr:MULTISPECIES: YggT family protein [unclassified Novosphingobium]KPF87881.1 hypothetical protein IP83_06975 [Novosphingobium sp. AAP93]MBY0393738.1 YggT family protein [Novosphingobium sp.]
MLFYQLINAILLLIGIVRAVVIVQFILFLLVAFNVVSMRNKFVSALNTALSAILDPILDPIRRVMPNTGGIDFSPMVVIFGLSLLAELVGFIGQLALQI